jgi:hypothetical protein
MRSTIRTISGTSSGHHPTNFDDVACAPRSESEQNFTAAKEHAGPAAVDPHVELTKVSVDEPEKLANLFMIPYIGSFAVDFIAPLLG